MKLMMITGAGISTGSGISTYRGEDGLYTAIEKKVGMPIHELLSPTGFAKNPGLVWKYWLEFALSLKNTEPSYAHKSIVSIAAQCDEFLEVTQNVDGLSAKAGLPADKLIELHGTSTQYHCSKCSVKHGLSIVEGMQIPPMCYRCDQENGAVIRPSVVLFNEFIDQQYFDKVIDFASSVDVLIIVGTSMQFVYLQHFLILAHENNAQIIWVDPNANTDKGLLGMTDIGKRLCADTKFVTMTADEFLTDIAWDLNAGLAGLRQGSWQ